MPSTMAPNWSQPSDILARDIVRYSDEELDRYLEANERHVDVKDPENLTEDFIQRLRTRVSQGTAAQSRPVDPDDLTARLEAIPPSTPEYDEEEEYRCDLDEETAHYNTLLNEGGRPSHPVSLGRDVVENPGEYQEILSFWQRFTRTRWRVFKAQTDNWRHFCRWQRKNREVDRLQKYFLAVKDDLVEHGFTRPFQLDEDPKRQDKLTTWIEYLDFEYWWYDKNTRSVKRHRPWYDKELKKLADLKVLNPSQMDDLIIQHVIEEDQAERDIRSAKNSFILAGPNAHLISDLSQEEIENNAALAQDRLYTAMESLKSIKSRDDLISNFIAKTKRYRAIKTLAEDRTKLLRWILQQIPLIEIEMNLLEVAERDSRGDIGIQQRFNLNEEQVSKRQIIDDESIRNLDSRIRASAADDHNSPDDGSCDDQVDGGRFSKKPKRSHSHSALETSHNPELALNEGHDSKEPATNRSLGSPGARNTITGSTLKKKRSNATTVAKQSVNKKAPGMKRTRGSTNLSALGSHSLRRSTRIRKLPVRFQ